jgi:hypothetical protein
LRKLAVKKPVAVLLCSLAIAAPAFAGEDSTDHWGDGGTGPSIFESPCGLADFKGEDSPMPEKCRPVGSSRAVRSSSEPDRPAQYAHSSAAAGATRSDAVVDDNRPAPTLNDTFHYPTSN